MMKNFLKDGELTDFVNNTLFVMSFVVGISGFIYAAIAWS